LWGQLICAIFSTQLKIKLILFTNYHRVKFIVLNMIFEFEFIELRFFLPVQSNFLFWVLLICVIFEARLKIELYYRSCKISLHELNIAKTNQFREFVLQENVKYVSGYVTFMSPNPLKIGENLKMAIHKKNDFKV
jgi:hypothetical protein